MSLPLSLLFCILQFEMNSSDSFTEFKLVHIFLRHRSWAEQRHLCYLSVAREKQFTRFFSAQTKTGILKGFQNWGVYVQKHSLTRRTITRHSVNKGANIVKQAISLFITIISIKHPISIKPRLLSEQSCIRQSHHFRISSTDSKDNEMCHFAQHIKHVTDRKVLLSAFIWMVKLQDFIHSLKS